MQARTQIVRTGHELDEDDPGQHITRTCFFALVFGFGAILFKQEIWVALIVGCIGAVLEITVFPLIRASRRFSREAQMAPIEFDFSYPRDSNTRGELRSGS